MVFSLQQRFFLLLLLPVALILILVGAAGFFYSKEYLLKQSLKQWKEVALVLEKSAHTIDMRLNDDLKLIDLIAKSGSIPADNVTQAYLIQQLSRQESVHFVDIEDRTSVKSESSLGGASHRGQVDSRPVDGLRVSEFSGGSELCIPTTDPRDPDRTLRISRSIRDDSSGRIRKLLVRVSFDSLMEPVRKMVQKEGSSACLVTAAGQVLAHTDKSLASRRMLGETCDPLEKKILKEICKGVPFGTIIGEGHPPDYIAGFYKIPSVDWRIVLYSKGRAVLRPLIDFRFYYSVAGIAALLIILILIRAITRSVGASIADISAAAAKVSSGDYSAKLSEDRSDEIGELKRNFNIMIDGLKRRDLIEQTFGRYVDKTVAEELMNKPEALRLGGEKRTVTVMMSDLRDFTSKSERLPPEQVINMLNRYFSRMVAVIERYRGIIVDFYGDSILVFFDGTGADVATRATDAVKCALEMQQEMRGFQQDNVNLRWPQLSMGIGIHTGEVIVGNIGTETRAKYGIVGSPVNLTDRIQRVAGYGKVVISEATFNAVSADINVSDEFVASLKGVEGNQKLYAVQSVTPERAQLAPGATGLLADRS
jgi:adenylate cyclase